MARTVTVWCIPLLLGFMAALPLRGAAPEDSDPENSRVEVHDGVVTVTLTEAQIERLALRIEAVPEVALPQAAPASAQVIDSAPLLELRQRLRNAQAELETGQQRITAARRHLARQDKLVQAGGAVSADERRAAELALERAKADVDSAILALAGLRETAGYQWGARLSAEALTAPSGLLDQLARHRRFLLLVAPAAGTGWQQEPTALRLQLPGPEAASAAAEILDEAPVVLAGQGRTWWAVTATTALRPGMALAAVPLDGPQLHGARVPESALLWHAGHRWFYLQTAAHRFERREALEPRALGAGQWLVTGLPPGAQVVTTGAQSLLGEELRWSIPTEDDD